MEFPIWAQVLIALCAVFGVYAAVRVITGTIFSIGAIETAVIVRSEEEYFRLELLLEEAKNAFFLGSCRKIAVLFVGDAATALRENGPDQKTVSLLERYGAEYYFAE